MQVHLELIEKRRSHKVKMGKMLFTHCLGILIYNAWMFIDINLNIASRPSKITEDLKLYNIRVLKSSEVFHAILMLIFLIAPISYLLLLLISHHFISIILERLVKLLSSLLFGLPIILR